MTAKNERVAAVCELLMNAGCTILTDASGWHFSESPRVEEDAIVEWATVDHGNDVDSRPVTPAFAPLNELTLVCNALHGVGYGWRLVTYEHGKPITRLYVFNAFGTLAEKVIAHVAQQFAGMERAPLMWGGREAREITVMTLLDMRAMAGCPSLLDHGARDAWLRSVAKVRGESLSLPLYASYEGKTEEDYTAALMKAVRLTMKRLPCEDERLRAIEERVWP